MIRRRGLSRRVMGSRFWAVELVNTIVTNGVKVGELRFSDTVGPAGLDLTDPSEASSRSFASGTLSGKAANAFDGAGISTYWGAPSPPIGHWIGWEFASPIVINQVSWTNMDVGWMNIEKMKVISSKDGVSFDEEWITGNLDTTQDAIVTITRP